VLELRKEDEKLQEIYSTTSASNQGSRYMQHSQEELPAMSNKINKIK